MFDEMRRKSRGTIILDNKKYYFKRNDAYVEILVEKIADLFNIKHAHYIPFKVDDMNFYISEDLNEQGEFTTADDIGITSCDIRDIRDFVLNRFPDDFDVLMDQIMRMFFMDLLILNIDRNTANWGFLTKDGHTEICILDNDLSFICYNSCMTATSNHKMDSYVEVLNIFECFPPEYVNMFLEMHDKLTLKELGHLIHETERDIGIDLPHKFNYLTRFKTMSKSIEELRQKKNLQLQKVES